jgi:hypothetical protein
VEQRLTEKEFRKLTTTEKHNKAAQKLFNEAMMTQIEELKKKYEAESGKTENQ